MQLIWAKLLIISKSLVHKTLLEHNVKTYQKYRTGFFKNILINMESELKNL